mgnify:CR=1 FL=1
MEKGIVVRPKVASLKQFWTEYRLIDNEKKQTGQSMTNTPLITPQPLEVVDAKPIKDIGNEKEIDSFEQLFEALSSRISEINSYIDELKEMKNSIDKTRRKLETDREKLASERSEFNTYRQKEESKLNKEKENLKINFNRLQTIIDDLDKKLVKPFLDLDFRFPMPHRGRSSQREKINKKKFPKDFSLGKVSLTGCRRNARC